MAEKTLSSGQKWFLRWVSPGFDWLIFYTVDPFQDSDSQAGSADKYSLLFWQIFFLRKKNRCEKFYWNFSILRSQKIEIDISEASRVDRSFFFFVPQPSQAGPASLCKGPVFDQNTKIINKLKSLLSHELLQKIQYRRFRVNPKFSFWWISAANLGIGQAMIIVLVPGWIEPIYSIYFLFMK